YDMLSGLSLALAVILLWRPYQVFQSGFQLSFGAVFAIASFCRALTSGTERLRLKAMRPESRHKRIPKDARLPPWVSMLIMGAGIQLFTLPLILWHYFVFPPYAVLLNLIVIPLMSTALGSGVAVTGISLLHEGVMLLQAGKFAALSVDRTIMNHLWTVLFAMAAGPGHHILRLYELLGREMMRLPFASVCPGRPALLQILVYYMLIGFMTSAYLANSRKSFCLRDLPDSTAGTGAGIITGSIGMGGEKASGLRIRAFIYTPALILIAGLTANSLTLRHIRPDCLTVTAIDVGQGDGFLVETPKRCFLIDSGSSSNRKFGENILEPLLLSKGITELEFAAVSHGDIDHTSGIKYLLEDASPVRIRRLVLPGPARDNENYDELKGQKESVYLDDGLLIASDGHFSLRCIYAGNAGFPEDMNRNSPALLLKAGMFSMLFTGDMTKEDEAELTGQYEKICGSIPVTVLKVAHHGSSTSTGDELLEAVRPRYALISAGRKNRYGHPSEEVTARLKDHGAILLETAKSGAVEISVKEDRMEIRRFPGKCADDTGQRYTVSETAEM
ncbi:MAG: ComEC/Rec2 family competence protein, partial [Lachnospiraceae bacterium]|nr:ComEC/Rec2 family competence protein [Lachnospiraceae bacterium]